mmetsp:Transcript_28977/g.27932  ORF Transcript_28977/g.27932 Transcript_28977/m.27932 type:complete len:216 (+) Transcript_28977:280-927(+)
MWVHPQEQFSYQVDSNNSIASHQQYGISKTRPITGGRRNNGNLATKGFPSKNPSTMDLDVSRLRPKVVRVEREKLFDDVLKQKVAINIYKEENTRLKTRTQMLEGEVQKQERLIDELLMNQDNLSGQVTSTKGLSKIKLESHLSQNLKRKIRDQQLEIIVKQEEVNALRKNIKVTRMGEIELEMKMYIDECQRLRGKLEEVMQVRGPQTDPQEVK